jgi:hypothetical protein
MTVGYIKQLQSDARQERMAIKRYSEAREKELKYWEKNRPRMESDLKELQVKYADLIDPVRKAGVEKLTAAATGIAAKRKWQPGEAKIDPDRDPTQITADERPRDPFPAFWRAKVLKAPTLDEPDTIDQAADAAKAAFTARLLVPDEVAYDHWRAVACEVCGEVALSAVVAENGSSGFTNQARKGRNPAVISWEAWEKYRNYIGNAKVIDNVRVLHQVVMARAHQGGTSRDTAYALIHDYLAKPNFKGTEDPEVWYDFARVCASVKNIKPGATNLLSPYQRAILCLRNARMYGFDRVTEAKASSDFAALQAAGKNYKEGFDQALNLPPIRASKVIPKGDRP